MKKEDYIDALKSFDYDGHDYLYIKGAIDAFYVLASFDDEITVGNYCEINNVAEDILDAARQRLLENN